MWGGCAGQVTRYQLPCSSGGATATLIHKGLGFGYLEFWDGIRIGFVHSGTAAGAGSLDVPAFAEIWINHVVQILDVEHGEIFSECIHREVRMLIVVRR